MKHDKLQLSMLVAALMLSCVAIGQTTRAPVAPADAASAGQAGVAGRIAAPYAILAGSPENAVALVNGLRTGTPAKLTTTSTDAGGTTVTTETSIAPPTKAMGWGNVSRSMALAQFALTKAGITNPTPADLQAALVGGNVKGTDGTTLTLAGVLQQRANGMGWGNIAKSHGTTMGALNRGVHAPAVAIATGGASSTSTSSTSTSSTSTSSSSTSSTGTSATSTTTTGHGSSAGRSSGVLAANGATTGSPHAPRGLVTASGTAAGAQHAKGVLTASGTAAGSHGVVSAAGGGANAQGRGIVTAQGGNGANGNPHGKGKPGG